MHQRRDPAVLLPIHFGICRELLAAVHGRPQIEVFSEISNRRGCQISLSNTTPGQPGDDEVALAVSSGETAATLAMTCRYFLSPMERDIVLALGPVRLQGAEIARIIGCLHGAKPTTNLKLLLSNLMERGVLCRAPDGYYISDQRILTLAQTALTTGTTQSQPGAA